jgi:hypothetical protein
MTQPAPTQPVNMCPPTNHTSLRGELSDLCVWEQRYRSRRNHLRELLERKKPGMFDHQHPLEAHELFAKQLPFIQSVLKEQVAHPNDTQATQSAADAMNDITLSTNELAALIHNLNSPTPVGRIQMGIWWSVFQDVNMQFTKTYSVMRNMIRNAVTQPVTDGYSTRHVVHYIEYWWQTTQQLTQRSPPQDEIQAFQKTWSPFRNKIAKLPPKLPLLTVCQLYLIDLYYLDTMMNKSMDKKWHLHLKRTQW